MSTVEKIIKSLEKLKIRHIVERDYEKAAEVKIIIDKIKKRLDEAL